MCTKVQLLISIVVRKVSFGRAILFEGGVSGYLRGMLSLLEVDHPWRILSSEIVAINRDALT
jgi:hypothetical protein